MSENEEWIDKLQVGDSVVVCQSVLTRKIRTVEKITKTLIVLNGNYRFNKQSGYEVGSSDYYSRTYIVELTPSIKEEFRRNNLCNDISGKICDQTKWRSLPTEKLEQILSILG